MASFPDTILSAMLGLKWDMPQSLGQSRSTEDTYTHAYITPQNPDQIIQHINNGFQVHRGVGVRHVSRGGRPAGAH